MAVRVVRSNKPCGSGDGNGHRGRVRHSAGHGLGMVRSQAP